MAGAAQCKPQDLHTAEEEQSVHEGAVPAQSEGVELGVTVLLQTTLPPSMWEIVSFSTKQAISPHLLSSL